jgi:hypothetical protein
MVCTIYCPKCGETIPVQVVVDEDFVPSNPSLGRTGSSRDYDNFSNLDDTPNPPALAKSVTRYVGMGHGGNKKTRKRSNSHKKKLTKKRSKARIPDYPNR